MRYGFIQEQQKSYPVTALCGVMQVSRSAHYAWAKRPEATAKDNVVELSIRYAFGFIDLPFVDGFL